MDPYACVKTTSLVWVNRVRALLGHDPIDELPRGIVDEEMHPLCLAIGAGAQLDGDLLDLRQHALTMWLPLPVQEFVDQFAAYEHPELLDLDLVVDMLLLAE